MEIGARLHHLQLLTPDPAKCAAFYGSAYAMQVLEHGAARICVARDRRLIFAPGPANQLGFAAFAFATEAELALRRERIEAHVPTAAATSPLFGNSAFEVTDPDGNHIVFGAPDSTAAPAAKCGAEALSARLQHCALRSGDPARLLPFYRDALGFLVSDSVHDEADQLRACFLRTDSEHHALALFHAAQAGHDHLSFETDSWAGLRDWADRITRQGIKMAWGIGRHGPGNDAFFMVRDPDGNLAEISTELEICEPTRAPGRWPHEERTLNLWGTAIMRSQ